MGQQGRHFVELVGVQLLHRARHGRVDVLASFVEL